MSFHTRRENRVRNHTVKGLALVAGAFLVAVALSASANAATLRRGSTGGSATVTGTLPGQVLWTYFDTSEGLTRCGNSTSNPNGCDVGGNGDNILSVLNPNGAANIALSNAHEQFVCAMVYVFDDDEEMGECCGCPVSSAGLLRFSVQSNLLSNWFGGAGADGQGAIAIVAAPINPALVDLTPSTSNGKGCPNSADAACEFGCDPTNAGGGYTVTTANNLLGSIVHNQVVTNNSSGSISGLTEVGLFDDAGGDPTNLTYLQNQCGANVQGGSGFGICSCPFEVPDAS